jgi:hypothetical protein
MRNWKHSVWDHMPIPPSTAWQSGGPHVIWPHAQGLPLKPTGKLCDLLSLTGDPSVCSISNPDFVIYSSVVSFYVPFGVTVLVYARIYVVLRQRRRKRILTRQNSQCISIRPGFPQQVSTWRGRGRTAPTLGLLALCPVISAWLCLSCHLGNTEPTPTFYSAGIVCALKVGNPILREHWVSLELTLVGKMIGWFLDCSTSFRVFHFLQIASSPGHKAWSFIWLDLKGVRF